MSHRICWQVWPRSGGLASWGSRQRRRAQKGCGTQEEAGRPQLKHWKIPKQERPQWQRWWLMPCCLAQPAAGTTPPWPQQDS